MKIPIDQINAMDRDHFVALLGLTFEDSPWVAERAWSARPFSSIDQLHAAMVSVVDGANPAEQLALLRAHPDLGTRARISLASTVEQSGAGLDQLSPGDFDLLQRLNAAYRDKFSFPFLFAVKGSTQRDILRVLEMRLDASAEMEFREALRQVYRIARFRLDETVQ